MNNEYKQELNKIIIAKRKELRHRKNRLNSNIFAGTCEKSIIAQRNTILYLEIQIEIPDFLFPDFPISTFSDSNITIQKVLLWSGEYEN